MNDNTGIFLDVPFDEYAKIDALNGSSLVNMRRSPMYYRHQKDHPHAPTSALITGIATHRMVLEPHTVDDMAVWGVLPEHKTDTGRQRPRNGRDWDKFQLANKGKLIVTADVCEVMVGMAVGARMNMPIRKYADAPGPTEVSMVWIDDHGRRWKCRLDKWCKKLNTVFDLKTCRSCRPYEFGRQSFSLGYHIKMAIQWMGVKALTDKAPHLKLGAIENRPPFESAVYCITSDTLLQGLEEAAELERRVTECEQTNNWPAEMEDESDLVMPNWATVQPDTEFELEGV